MTPSALRRVSLLWDALERQPVGERAAWLAGLSAQDAEHVPALEAMGRADDAAADPLGLGPPAMTGAGPPTPAGSHAAGELIGPYRLARRLGQGGMGEVWLARRDDRLLDRDVAIKLPLLLTNQASLRRRFERERDILAGLTHPNIARLYDAGVGVDGQPYMALEYVEGEPITAYCDRLTLSVADRIGLFLQVLGAVQYAHSRLVIHRDVKPSNILVTAGGEVRLLDFGIAKLLDDGSAGTASEAKESTALTRFGGAALTLDFASPEQILQQPVGTLSDVYSLGVLLYELLCGERPCRWRQTTREALEAAVLEAPRPLPGSRVVDRSAALRGLSARALVRQLRGDLDTIALKALKPLPADRYPTADALGADLRRWLGGEAVLARPDSRAYRVRRFVGRNRLAVGSAVLVVAGLSGGLGVALWQAQVARTEARTAQATEAFLTQLFRANSLNQADPAQMQRMTVRQLLDLGAERVTQALNDQPEVKLRLLATLSDMFREMDALQKSVEMRTLHLQLLRERRDANSPDIVAALIDLAMNSGTQVSGAAHAEAWLDEAERILDATGDTGSDLRADFETAKASQNMGDKCLVARYAGNAAAIYRRRPASQGLVDSLLDQAYGSSLCGDPAAALNAVDEALRTMAALKIRLNVHYAYGIRALAQSRLGFIGASLASARESLAAARSLSAPNDPPGSAILSAALVSSMMLIDSAQPRESLRILTPLLEQALETGARGDGYMVARILVEHARVAALAGDVPEATRQLQQAAGLLQGFADQENLRAFYLDALAQVLMAQGRLDEADHALDEAEPLHLRMNHGRTPQINDHAATRVRCALGLHQPQRAVQALATYRADPAAPGRMPRSHLEQRLLDAEIQQAGGHVRESLALASGIESDIGRQPESRFLRDLAARAAEVAAGSLQALGQPAEAAAQRRIAAAIASEMKRAAPSGTEE